MSDRFPPLRPQSPLTGTTHANGRSLPTPAPVDLTMLAAFVFVVALSLI
jgi:hypothetical protein